MIQKKQLFVDAQSFQTPNWDRGMGRYSFSLLKTVLNDPVHNPFVKYQIIFIISSNLPQFGVWRDELEKSFNNIEFKTLDLITTTQEDDCVGALSHNQLVIENYIKSAPVGSEYICLSLLDDLIFPIIPDLKHISSYLVFYDLIPLLFRSYYFQNKPEQERCYLLRLTHVLKVKAIFTISVTTARDLAYFLNVPADIITPILGGAFYFKDAKKPKIKSLIKEDKYILAVLGDDPRKNIIRSCEAYLKFSLKNRNYKLVLPSHYSQATKNAVKQIVPQVIFTDNVNDQELSWLYSNTAAVLFTSEYEGLGMPLLEGIQAGVPIVCSDIDVMREIAGDLVWYANPYDTEDIANALTKATNEIIDQSKKKEYQKILNKFSWTATADRLNKAVLRARSENKSRITKKNRVAIIGPTPESICSVGKFIQEQANELMSKSFVDFYIEDSPSSPAYKKECLTSLTNCYKIEEFAARSRNYNHIVYHIGNSDFHLLTTRLALSIPGTVVLHDTWIEGLWAEMYRNKLISENRLRLETELNKTTDQLKTRYIVSVVSAAKQIVVHSDYAREALMSLGIKKNILKLQLPISQFNNQNITKLPKHRDPVIGLGGILTLEKGLDLINKLLNDKRFNVVKFHVFGHKTKFDGGLIKQFSHNPRIKLSTDITDLEYLQELEGVDVLLNYRSQYNGEASRATVEAMRMGVVPVVRDIGWFSELPDSVCVKVKTENQVADVLIELINNRAKLNKKRKAALEFIRQECQIKDYVNSLIKYIDQ